MVRTQVRVRSQHPLVRAAAYRVDVLPDRSRSIVRWPRRQIRRPISIGGPGPGPCVALGPTGAGDLPREGSIHWHHS